MRATFEVTAQSAPGLLKMAREQAGRFAAGMSYRIIEIESTKPVLQGTGEIPYWIADVTIEIDTARAGELS